MAHIDGIDGAPAELEEQIAALEAEHDETKKTLAQLLATLKEKGVLQ